MVRIGILGTDGGTSGGHARNICRILDKTEGVKICGLFGDVPEETDALAQEFSVDFTATTPEDLIDRVDAVFVLPRHGGKHKEYAMPFIEKGMPVFIDKPFTCSVGDAEEIIAAADKSGSIICGGSYLKYAPEIVALSKNMPDRELIQSGIVAYPTSMTDKYGGLHFYSHHLIEVMLTVFGTDVVSVDSVATAGCPVAVANYGSFSVVMNFAANEGALFAGVYYTRDMFRSGKIEMAGLDDYQCKRFIDAVKSGESDNMNFMLTAVKVCNALIKSLDGKREVFLNEM